MKIIFFPNICNMVSTGIFKKNVKKIKCKLKNKVLWEIKNNRKIRKIKRKINKMS